MPAGLRRVRTDHPRPMMPGHNRLDGTAMTNDQTTKTTKDEQDDALVAAVLSVARQLRELAGGQS